LDKIKNELSKSWLLSIRSGVNLVLNLFFPPRCSFCTQIMEWSRREEELICPDCLNQISLIDSEGCLYCGKKLLDEKKECSCRQDERKLYYAKVYSACEYSGIIRQKLLDFKFSGKKELSRVFAWLIIRKLQMTNKKFFDIIISVPMHETSVRKRGYNQSELIAEHIASYYSTPLVVKNLVKTRETLAQSKLDKKDRIQNLKDAFKTTSKKELVGKKILLVDDILTTGSTVNECSKVLIESGAKEVFVATAATGKIVID